MKVLVGTFHKEKTLDKYREVALAALSRKLPAVAGQQAEDDVDGGGDGEVGDGGVAGAGPLQQQHREVGELHPEVDHVDKDDALLALAVGVLLVSRLQTGVVQPAWHTALLQPPLLILKLCFCFVV